MTRSRLAPALAASLAAHAAVVGATTLWLTAPQPAQPQPARLTVALAAVPPRPAPVAPPPQAALPVEELVPAEAAPPARSTPEPAVPAAEAVTEIQPTPLHEAAPIYPEAALLHGLTGSVQLELEIDAAGVVRAARVLAGSIDGVFDQAALDAAWATRFIPARRNGVPVASTLRPVMVFDAALPLQAALDH